LGPAPFKPYNKNRTFYRFRWFYDYSGGQLTNFGVHYMASIHWALGLSAPQAVVAIGGKFANYDNREVPDTLEVMWHYPGDTLVTFSQYNATAAPAPARPCELEFRGTKGTLYLDLHGDEIVPAMGRGHRAVHEQRRREQAPLLRVPPALSPARLKYVGGSLRDPRPGGTALTFQEGRDRGARGVRGWPGQLNALAATRAFG